jgi:coatomer subunit beta
LLEEAEKENKSEELSPESKQITTSSSRRILADGTYATETAFSSNSSTLAKLEAIKAAVKPPLRCNYAFYKFNYCYLLSS